MRGSSRPSPSLSLRNNNGGKYLKCGLVPILMLWIIFCVIVLSELSSVIHSPAALERSTIATPSTPSDAFKGEPWNSPLLKSRTVLHSTPFARCEIHNVYTEDHSQVQTDWLWFDETDHVNVIVFDKSADEFIFFKQHKYALESESLAVVGGFHAPGESGFDACRREVKEELGYTSKKELHSMTTHTPYYDPNHDDGWKVLGRYRTAANRGGGFLTACFLRDAVPIPKELHKIAGFEGLGEGAGIIGDEAGQRDGEAQKIVRMSVPEARQAVLDGRFQEVKWTASFALALLQMDNNNEQ
ncbi:hypothetical protein TrLO_g355 [Triparma laevis f. longispina]|uniref:Nudix hydrolase domain-containing protein n=1 Tax=Triparma laevis f. longispina TaxID=1714387 RepID=A0A9W7C9W2_9STRA|nr:hypothetical protein TrLO_g355 [Triparma laevis f. longispina]